MPRFKTLDVSAAGSAKDNYSARNTNGRVSAEVSPLAFYARLFGPEFVDPNKADFKPDPKVMTRKSVLSAFMEAQPAAEPAKPMIRSLRRVRCLMPCM